VRFDLSLLEVHSLAQQDPRRVDSASQMAQAPTEYSSMEDLLMDRNLLGGGRL
jgi:hypothetical protein